ncbi:hypothetical protein ACT29H_02240 [Thermophagus sp. OGC60D27]|uniref:hypothetical protein n=1 Tax=Thermophagus sp. OGC60D27 TaxID=3458415 RepID=UPI0040377980
MKKRKITVRDLKQKLFLRHFKRETIQEIGKKYDLHPNQISTWKSQFLSKARHVFERGVAKDDFEKEKRAL